MWVHPLAREGLRGDPYLHLRSRYRPRRDRLGRSVSSPSIAGDSGHLHTDNQAVPDSLPIVDLIPFEPGVVRSYCSLNPAECTVNGATPVPGGCREPLRCPRLRGGS